MTKLQGFYDRQLLSKIKSYLDTASADEVILSSGFWRGFECPSSCGACCHRITLEYLKDSDRWRKFEEIYPEQASKFECSVDKETGVEIMHWLGGEGYYCPLLDKSNGRCTIRESNPLPCRFAPLKFIDKRQSSNKTYLNASAYGRGWAFTKLDGTKGVDCIITPFNLEKSKIDLEMLKELRDYSQKLNIPTKLPYIIEVIEFILEGLESGEIDAPPTESFSFTEKNIL